MPDTCKICGTTLTSKNRRKSHILTRSSYFNQQISRNGEHLMMLKKGEKIISDAGHYAWEWLLCGHCESKVGEWEGEREKLFSSDIRSKTRPEDQPYLETDQFDQNKIKLACLADIYRCSVTSGLPYKDISLGEKHESNIRKMLASEYADNKEEYPIVLCRFNSEYDKIDRISGPPIKSRGPDGIRIYKTVVPRGWIWTVKIDSRQCEVLEKVSIGSFNQTLTIINYGDARKSNEFRSIYETIVDTI